MRTVPSFNCLAFTRGADKYIFVYDDQNEHAAYITAVKWYSYKDLNFTASDCDHVNRAVFGRGVHGTT